MKILLIDDDQQCIKLMKRILSKMGCDEIFSVNDGLDGYCLLKANPEINIVIIDHNMPYINGRDFIEKCRKMEMFAKTKLITFTSDENQIVTSIKAGANDYILKPLSAEKVKEVLHRNLDKYE